MSMIKSGSPKFNLNFHNKLKKSIPKNILDLGIKFQEVPTGYIRFDNQLLSYIYLDVKLKPFHSCLLKFKYDNKIPIFEYIYFGFIRLPISLPMFKDKFYEFRCNSNLELDSIYERFGGMNQIRYKKGFLVSTKKDESYWVNLEKRDFTKELKVLHNNKVIKSYTGSVNLIHLLRDNKDSFYIKIIDGSEITIITREDVKDD